MEEASEKPTVLVAEDDEDIRDMLVFALRRAGYRVVEAPDGLDALRAITGSRPDLVLLDIGMPRLDGKAVCRIVRSKRDEAPPIIFLTAAARPAERVEGLDLGAVDYVTKPFDLGELLARVRVALRTAGKLPAAAPASSTRVASSTPPPRSGATSNLRDLRPGLLQ